MQRDLLKSEPMFPRLLLRKTVLFCVLPLCCIGVARRAHAASVWKVTGPNGGVLYLGGSIHGLDSTDYPLPSAYNRAFDLSSRIVFEDDESASPAKIRRFLKSWEYPKGDNLKNHIDPRVYDYLRRIFALAHVPEAEFSRLRPWALVMGFTSRDELVRHRGIFGEACARQSQTDRGPGVLS